MANPETTTPTDLSQWTKVISPYRGFWDMRLGQLWQYRDLILVFVHRNFTATYKQTILGPLWFFVQPLMTTIVFTVLFGKVANLPTDGIPKFLFYMLGQVAWGYFSECLTKTGATFSQNAGLFGKVYFPRMAVPISVIITSLMTFALQMVFFLAWMAWFAYRGAPVHPNWHILALPLLVIEMAMLGLGAGCFVTALTTKYRDLNMLVGFGVQLWMYASCVVTPLSLIDEKYRWIFVLNPMVPIIEGFRFAFFGQGIVEKWQILMGFGVSSVILVLGLALFNHVEKSFTDTV